LNQLVSAYGSMETIHLTPLPVAYLIHMRQVLALFGGVLPFALVEEMGWYAVLLTSLVMFTLYGESIKTWLIGRPHDYHPLTRQMVFVCANVKYCRN
jgi:predicted membrane chloride channel (bestrophin family)